MDSQLSLATHPLLEDAALRRLMAVLGAGQAMLVGGCVRAAVVGESIGDIDIATMHEPGAVMALLQAAGIKVVPTGIDHGTVTAVVDGRGFEVTTLRRDVETDGRRAVVAFTKDWAEDAQRRDFTMNTLLMDMDGRVFDPTGRGLEDLKAGLVHFVGDAETRIREDALRILRFFRFYARYGQGAPDVQGLTACQALAGSVATLSRERITAELEKLLPLRGAGAALEVMIGAGILDDLFRHDFNRKLYDVLRGFVVSLVSDGAFLTLFYYSVYENELEKLDRKIEKYIIFSNSKKSMLYKFSAFLKDQSESLNKNLYLFGRDITLSGCLLLSVLNGKEMCSEDFEDLRAQVLSTPVPVFPLRAADVMHVTGLGQGPAIGDVLETVESWWLDHDTAPDHAACLDYASKLVHNAG